MATASTTRTHSIVVFRRQMVFIWPKMCTTLKSKSTEAITLIIFIGRLWFESRLEHLRTWEDLLLLFFSIAPRHFQILKLTIKIHLKGREWSSQVSWQWLIRWWSFGVLGHVVVGCFEEMQWYCCYLQGDWIGFGGCWIDTEESVWRFFFMLYNRYKLYWRGT
jgi:hypothetical protein